MPTAAIIGAGSMGTIIADGLQRAGWTSDSVTLCARRPERAEELARAGYRATTNASDAAAGADLIVLATKPKDIPAVLESIQATVRAGQTVLSVAAGVTIATIEAALPGAAVVRAMPNTPAALGRGATGFAMGRHTTDSDEELVRSVLGAIGICVEVPEGDLDAVTALSGSGPAYVFRLAEAMQEAGVALGLDPEVATTLASHTVAGAGDMLVWRPEGAAELRKQVTSPGGTTAAALDVLESGGLVDLIREAMTAARHRATELGSNG